MYRRVFAALWMPNGSLSAPYIAIRPAIGSKIKKAGAGFVVALLSMAFLHSAAFAQSHPINASIDVSKTGTPISQNIYGQFLEHGGDIVNTGIWSEMLVDRKFFYPVDTAAPKPPPVMGNAAGSVGERRAWQEMDCPHHRPNQPCPC